ncbi:RNA polymerase sigma factor [Intestinimonas butyriciproducens]|uniref:RNA polymerase sigma factor n=1 Tax=Intestinimonas butyriciproducens TaxID=1297617 RepID=UPI00189D16CB|nr:RNA polymerase sigma factor [Intestinimonas butyriciproducens]
MPGQNEWFDQLYREHSARLFKQAYYVLHNSHLAEDLVEETFLILLYKQQDLVKHPNLAGWLSLTLKNLICDELKSARHRLEMPLISDDSATCVDTYHQPLDELLPKGLLPKEREILILLFEEQLSYDEIAQHLGISVLSCRTRAFRAKAHYKVLIRDAENKF